MIKPFPRWPAESLSKAITDCLAIASQKPVITERVHDLVE